MQTEKDAPSNGKKIYHIFSLVVFGFLNSGKKRCQDKQLGDLQHNWTTGPVTMTNFAGW